MNASVMRHRIIIPLAASLALVAACDPLHSPAFKAARSEAINSLQTVREPTLSELIELNGLGLLVDFRGTKGWRINRPGEAGQQQFATYLDIDARHSAVLTARAVFPKRNVFADLADYYTFMSGEVVRVRQDDDVIFDHAPDASKAPLCMSLHTQARRADEPTAPGIIFVVDIYQYICAHPNRPNVFVNIRYLERFREAANITDVEARAKSFLERVTFAGHDA